MSLTSQDLLTEVPLKTWHVHDLKTSRHPELDGESVHYGEVFSNGLMYPREPGCRCHLTVEVPDRLLGKTPDKIEKEKPRKQRENDLLDWAWNRLKKLLHLKELYPHLASDPEGLIILKRMAEEGIESKSVVPWLGEHYHPHTGEHHVPVELVGKAAASIPKVDQIARDRSTSKSLDAFMQSMRDSRDDFDSNLEAAALKHSSTKEKLLEDLETTMKEALGKSEIRIRLTTGVLGKILDDGRFKTQYETGKSGGGFVPDKRLDFEERHFNIPKPTREDLGQDTPYSGRPVYGFVKARDDRESSQEEQYGTVEVVLKDQLKARSTVTLSNSLDSYGLVAATPLNDVDIRSVPLWVSFTENKDKEVRALKFLRTKDLDDLTISYAEAQVHGGVKTEDIDHVIFHKDPGGSIKKRLDGMGIVHEDDIRKMPVGYVTRSRFTKDPMVVTSSWKKGAGVKTDGWQEFLLYELKDVDQKLPEVKAISEFYRIYGINPGLVQQVVGRAKKNGESMAWSKKWKHWLGPEAADADYSHFMRDYGGNIELFLIDASRILDNWNKIVEKL